MLLVKVRKTRSQWFPTSKLPPNSLGRSERTRTRHVLNPPPCSSLSPSHPTFPSPLQSPESSPQTRATGASTTYGFHFLPRSPLRWPSPKWRLRFPRSSRRRRRRRGSRRWCRECSSTCTSRARGSPARAWPPRPSRAGPWATLPRWSGRSSRSRSEPSSFPRCSSSSSPCGSCAPCSRRGSDGRSAPTPGRFRSKPGRYSIQF